MPTKSTTKAKAQFLQARNLGKIPWLVHGFSTRAGGLSRVYGGHALNLGFTKHDVRETVEKNRILFIQTMGVATWPLVTVRQIHSDLIHCVDRPRGLPASDVSSV